MSKIEFLIAICIYFKPFPVESCILCNNKYIIASIQTKNAEICAYIAVLVFKLLSRKVWSINRKENRNC